MDWARTLSIAAALIVLRALVLVLIFWKDGARIPDEQCAGLIPEIATEHEKADQKDGLHQQADRDARLMGEVEFVQQVHRCQHDKRRDKHDETDAIPIAADIACGFDLFARACGGAMDGCRDPFEIGAPHHGDG